jgi:hypothetical protein
MDISGNRKPMVLCDLAAVVRIECGWWRNKERKELSRKRRIGGAGVKSGKELLMMMEIQEQIKQLNKWNSNPEGNIVSIDSITYIKHCDFLMNELRKVEKQSEQWELKYYRQKEKGE